MGAICRHFGSHHRYEDVRSLSAAQRTSEEVRLRAGSRGGGREGTTWQVVSVPIIFGSDKVVEDSPWRSRQPNDTTFPPIPDQALALRQRRLRYLMGSLVDSGQYLGGVERPCAGLRRTTGARRKRRDPGHRV